MPWKLNSWAPLSRAGGIWQSGRLAGGAGLAVMALIAAPVLAGPVPPPPGGRLLTLKLGRYQCELPGDALSEVGIHVPGEDFSIEHGSLYQTPAGRGTYLSWAKTVTMTSGPKIGQRFRLVTPNLLRRLNADGSEAPLRCIRKVLNNDADFSEN